MQKNYFLVALVMLVFFVISFITNIMGPIFPALVKDFNVSLGLAGLLPFAFFAAYGFMSIPAGMMIHRLGEKPVMVFAFMLATLGSFLFASAPSFNMAMLSLFMIGAGMAMLQVAINPLLRVAGGEEHFAFFSVLAQLAFGGAATLGPHAYQYVVEGLASATGQNIFISTLESIVPENMPWISMYWVFALISLVFVIIVSVLKLPKIELKADELAGAWQVHQDLFKNKTIKLFFLGIVAYVGTEQGVANAISIFLQRYHNYDPLTVGADTVSYFWLLLTMGCFFGLILLKLLDSRKILIIFTSAAMLALLAAIFGSAKTVLYAFPMIGFFLSVMWSVIFSLALNSMEKNHGSFSGILCTGILGGAIASPIIGFVADITGSLKVGLLFLFVTLAYILFIGIWAKPLIVNQTIWQKNN